MRAPPNFGQVIRPNSERRFTGSPVAQSARSDVQEGSLSKRAWVGKVDVAIIRVFRRDPGVLGAQVKSKVALATKLFRHREVYGPSGMLSKSAAFQGCPACPWVCSLMALT